MQIYEIYIPRKSFRTDCWHINSPTTLYRSTRMLTLVSLHAVKFSK